MPNRLSRAVSGDEKPSELLTSEGVARLKERAGHLPLITKNKPKKSALKAAQSSEDLQSEIFMLRKANDLSFDDYEESALYFAANHLKPLMPRMPLARLNRSLYEILRWINGRAWIAGSAALWCVDADTKWMYRDVDVFCRSVEFYEMLRSELIELECGAFETFDHSTEFYDSPFQLDELFSETVTLICPGEKDWDSVEGLLTGFDWTICAVALKDSSTAYAYSPFDVREQQFTAIRLDYPRRSLKRLMKYANRGYYVRHAALEALALDGRVHEDFEVMNQAIQLDNPSRLGDIVRRYFRAVAEIESDDDVDHSEYEDYDEEDYSYS